MKITKPVAIDKTMWEETGNSGSFNEIIWEIPKYQCLPNVVYLTLKSPTGGSIL